MSKIIFKPNAGGIGGEFIQQEKRYSSIAQVDLTETKLLGEVRQGYKKFFFSSIYETGERDFNSQEAAIQFGQIFLKEKCKGE